MKAERIKGGKFVISLDFELLWGIFDHADPVSKELYFDNTRRVIPRILDLFKSYDIHCTWAIVGMLFHKNWGAWKDALPTLKPSYKQRNLSAYSYAEENLQHSGFEEQLFSPDLIQLINESDNQEIGTHTYSHYYCLEEGQSSEEFKEDLKKCISVARELNITLKSLVFPRNQMNNEYLKICYDLGIENVRSNPKDWYWLNPQSNNIAVKIARSGDAYFNFGKKSYALDALKNEAGLPLQQMASRFLRPVESNTKLRKLKLERILDEMELAAKNNEVYHLWWHPHNFGDHPEESISDLQLILEKFSKLKEMYNFQSLTMEELGKLVKR